MKNKTTILIAGAVMQLFLGIIYVWSVLAAPVSEFFNWDISSAKLTSSFMLCFFVLGILAGGRIQQKILAKFVVLAGGVMLSLGMISSAFIPGGYGFLMYITYGIVGGFGVGMAYNAIITSAQKSFPEKRGLATGISVSAFGFSTVIFAPLIEYMISGIGVKMTFITLGIAFIVVIAALFSFITIPQEEQKSNANAVQGKQYDIKEMMQTKEFYFITISLMLATSVFFILNPSFKTIAVERGLSPAIATLLVMITGIASALGRLLAPYASDKLGREKTVAAIIAITALGSFGLCFAKGALLVVIIAIIAFCYGGYSGIYPVLTGDYFGLKNVGSNYGAVMVGFALSALLFPMVMNLVPSDTIRFIVLGALAIVGTVLVLLLKRRKD